MALLPNNNWQIGFKKELSFGVSPTHEFPLMPSDNTKFFIGVDVGADNSSVMAISHITGNGSIKIDHVQIDNSDVDIYGIDQNSGSPESLYQAREYKGSMKFKVEDEKLWENLFNPKPKIKPVLAIDDHSIIYCQYCRRSSEQTVFTDPTDQTCDYCLTQLKPQKKADGVFDPKGKFTVAHYKGVPILVNDDVSKEQAESLAMQWREVRDELRRRITELYGLTPLPPEPDRNPPQGRDNEGFFLTLAEIMVPSTIIPTKIRDLR